MVKDERIQPNGRGRLKQLGEFLQDYVSSDRDSLDKITKQQADAQHWNALAFLSPEDLTNELAKEYRNIAKRIDGDSKSVKPSHLRMANLMQVFEKSLEGSAKPSLRS